MYIHEYADEIIFIKDTRRMDLSNSTIDYIKTCNNDSIGMKSALCLSFNLVLVLVSYG